MTETTDGFPSAWDNLVHTIYGLRDGHRLTSDVLTAVVLYRDEEVRAALEAKVIHGFEPGRWWRAWTEDGGLWMESSDEQEVRDGCPVGGKVQRLWVCEYEPLEEWRDA